MKHAHFKLILAVFSLMGACKTAIPVSLAGEMDSGCDCGCNYESTCCVCRVCDKLCQFRVIDGCTKCAWSRTWHAPNALATPLSQYYVPRPPQCCWYNGCAACYGNATGATWDVPCDANCQNRMTLASSEVPPDATPGSQFERLGKIRNELDVVGPMGGPAPGRALAPGR